MSTCSDHLSARLLTFELLGRDEPGGVVLGKGDGGAGSLSADSGLAAAEDVGATRLTAGVGCCGITGRGLGFCVGACACSEGGCGPE